MVDRTALSHCAISATPGCRVGAPFDRVAGNASEQSS